VRRPWLLVVLVGALALWLWRQPHEEAPEVAAGGARHRMEPGYVATGAVMTETGVDGQPLYRLRADRIAQPDPASDITMAAPQFQYQGTTVWTVSAHDGVLPPTEQEIRLSGDVLARADQAGSEPMQLHTATLTVNMQTRSADTADPVTMDWGANRLSATGLHADMQADYLRLKSPVHGEFSRAAQ
jgi:LPS export ABC transporter protein LptC